MHKINLTRYAAHLHLLRLAAPLRLQFGEAIRDSGWLRSFVEQKPVDAAGNPIPFMSYAAIELLTARVPAGVNVFEFGSGYSTLWWAVRARHVVSCEHDERWRALVRQMAPPRVDILHRALDPYGSYPSAIAEAAGPFDVVVIDGRQRVECSRASTPFLTDHGVIVWDDSDRERYKPGIWELREKGFKQLQLACLGPIIADKKCTSLFYRNFNILGL
jgi:hypothetical protein